MTKEELAKVLGAAYLKFPSLTFHHMIVEAWFLDVGRFEAKTFEKALHAACRQTAPFFPPSPLVQQFCEKLETGPEPDADAAYELALVVARRAGKNRQSQMELSLEMDLAGRYPTLRTVINRPSMYHALCRVAAPYNPRGYGVTQDEANAIKGSFLRAYKSEQQNRKLERDVDEGRRQLTAHETKFIPTTIKRIA